MVILGCGHHERKREIRREAILAAAYDLFLEKGYEATTLERHRRPLGRLARDALRDVRG